MLLGPATIAVAIFVWGYSIYIDKGLYPLKRKSEKPNVKR
jgi:hypothetical protein